MKYAVFSDDFCRDETVYGLFKIVRETRTRWYFECVVGNDFNLDGFDGRYVFNYHDDTWLDKNMARKRAVAWIEDVEMFDSVVQAHKDKEAAIKAINKDANDDRTEARDLFTRRIHNYSTEAPE